MSKFMDVATGALEGQVRALINKLVDELEESAMAAALREVREKLAEWRLISDPAV
jgi:ribosomal silencing factor RsfS